MECIDLNDHHLIQRIYLPQIPQQDSVVWSHTRDGDYTVKTGYHMITSARSYVPDRRPPLASHPDLAKNIWGIDSPPKLKHFYGVSFRMLLELSQHFALVILTSILCVFDVVQKKKQKII